MSTVICMRGYPASGKSTMAYEMAAVYNDGGKETIVVNRDQLRKMTYGVWWGPPIDEDVISQLEKAAVVEALESDINVIIDATHLEPRYLYAWAKLAARYGADFRVQDVKTHPSDCAARDYMRAKAEERSVGAGVIHKMAKRWPIEKWPEVKPYGPTVEPYTVPERAGWTYPNCIIVDIDGTAAHMAGRSPYDYTRVSEDIPDEDVRALVNYHFDRGDFVIFCSGRDSSCRDDTQRWLSEHGFQYDYLFMRPTVKGPKEPDWVIKLALFNEYIRDNYNVRFVLDDRQQVVQLWRRLGLKCWQVAPGLF